MGLRGDRVLPTPCFCTNALKIKLFALLYKDDYKNYDKTRTRIKLIKTRISGLKTSGIQRLMMYELLVEVLYHSSSCKYADIPLLKDDAHIPSVQFVKILQCPVGKTLINSVLSWQSWECLNFSGDEIKSSMCRKKSGP